ncbi:testis-expressed protein 48 [Cervus canadensis]|uniref:testis-expressed protein 48 n=1 Tax=Cervus canadensis TaxID=1574408 RepID=UPI001CA3416F|nr:testis-expressed protein 48 [Cervus canadensis]
MAAHQNLASKIFSLCCKCCEKPDAADDSKIPNQTQELQLSKHGVQKDELNRQSLEHSDAAPCMSLGKATLPSEKTTSCFSSSEYGEFEPGALTLTGNLWVCECSLNVCFSLQTARTVELVSSAERGGNVRTRMGPILFSRPLHFTRQTAVTECSDKGTNTSQTEAEAGAGVGRGAHDSQTTPDLILTRDGGDRNSLSRPKAEASLRVLLSFLLSDVNSQVSKRGFHKRRLSRYSQDHWPYQPCLIGRP